MTCEVCTEARQAPENCRLFADYCLHCAARRIQYIQRRMNLSPTAKSARCRKALSDALALGLEELEIRRLAKLPEWQVQPVESSPAPRKRGK